MDKTTYLNHYYFISILSFLMIFLPANSYFAIDSKLKGYEFKKIPKWCTDCIKMLLFIVYFYSGLAKLNSDWLIEAQPLKIWLTSSYDLPIIGSTLMQQNWVHYAMSWGGMFYDIFIPFLLLIPKTRNIAFLLVIIFHVLTKILFPAIGMFPFIMILGCLIFFDNKFHEKIIRFISKYLQIPQMDASAIKNKSLIKTSFFSVLTIGFFLFVQFLLPLRHNLYDGELFWTERGYRFSWRVMLVEKKGFAEFKLIDNDNSNSFYIKNEDHLTDFQEKQMSFQPDFIKEFVDYLGDFYKAKGYSNIDIHVDCFVTLNGRRSKRLIKKNTDILNIDMKTFYKNCIIPFEDEIKKI